MTPEEHYKAETGKEARVIWGMVPFEDETIYTEYFVQWLKSRLEKTERDNYNKLMAIEECHKTINELFTIRDDLKDRLEKAEEERDQYLDELDEWSNGEYRRDIAIEEAKK